MFFLSLFFYAFERVREAAASCVMSLRLSLRMKKVPAKIFNAGFYIICPENPNLLKTGQK